MMYGLSKTIDILSVALDYGHSSSEECRLNIEKALSAIGHYALTVVSTIDMPKSQQAKEVRREVFESRNFDGEYFMSLPPKQALHVLRLAVLQAIEHERANGCLKKMTEEKHVALLSHLNDYCGGVSSVSSSVSSSKLPFAYVHLVNWGVKILMAFLLHRNIQLPSRRGLGYRTGLSTLGGMQSDRYYSSNEHMDILCLAQLNATRNTILPFRYLGGICLR